MALTTGSGFSVEMVRDRINGSICWAHILFTISGTYAQANNSTLLGLAALISGNTRNGRSIALLACMPGQAATIQTDGTEMGLKTCAISGADATFELTGSDNTTEFTDATAIPAQARPFGLLVAFKYTN